MKICFISPKAYSLFNPEVEGNFGGAEVQLSLMAKELLRQNRNLEISFIVGDYGQQNVEVYDGIKIYKSLKKRVNPISKIMDFFNVFRHIDADIYIQRVLREESVFMAAYCRLRGKKFVYMVANDGETDGTHKRLSNLLKRKLMEKVFVWANIVITQNMYQKQSLELKGIKSLLIKSGYLIPNSINISDRSYHLWVGRSDSIKRPHLFIEIARNFPTEQFLLICPKSTYSSEQEYSDLLKNIKKQSNVKFVNYVPFHQIDTYFKDALTFINTSENEGYPNTFVQAAKNAVPILSLNVNPNNFLEEYNCGYYCAGNLLHLINQLKLITENSTLWKKLSKNAYHYAKENHNLSQNTAAFLLALKSKVRKTDN